MLIVPFILIFSLISPLCADKIRPVVVPQSSLVETTLPLQSEDEVIILDRLIEATSRQLHLQKTLKDAMIEFQEQRKAFELGDQSKRRAGLMVRFAREILEAICEQHIQYMFPQDYLEELQVFSSIAGKNRIKGP